MPPRSTKSKEVQGEVVPSSRRSSRLAPPTNISAESKGTGAKEKGNKKRSADVDENIEEKGKKTKIAKEDKSDTGNKAKTGTKVEISESDTDSGSESRTKSKSEPKVKVKPKAQHEDHETEKEEENGGKGSILKKGAKLPSITLENEDGEVVDVGGLSEGGKGVVIFVYPKADTPGCTNQACGFRDHLSQIQGMGYEIYGLSKDKPAALKRWKTKKGLNYTLLSDPQSRLIKRLGAFLFPNNSCRSHFIFDPKGELVDIAIKVKPVDDPKNCLEFIKTLHA